MKHNTLNVLNRVFLKPVLGIVPINRPLLDTLPKLIHLFDFAAPTVFRCHIECFKLDYMEAEWVYSYDALDNEDVVLYLHGGGYLGFSPVTHRSITTTIAKLTRRKVLAISYRKTPQFKYPSQLEDALLAYKFLLQLGYNSIAVMGDSAGGNLSLALTHKLLSDKVSPLPSSLSLISPWADLARSEEDIFLHDLEHVIPVKRLKEAIHCFTGGQIDSTDPRISPVYADYSDPDFPPTLIHVGSDELLLPDSLRLYEQAKSHGASFYLKVWDEGCHVFQAWPQFIKEAMQSLIEISEFMEHYWHRPS